MSGNINQSFNINFDQTTTTKDNFGISYDKQDSNTTNCADNSVRKNNFKFPPPPTFCKMTNNQSGYISDSDTSGSDYVSEKLVIRKKRLPPIGVFWDIENCQVPKGRSAVSIAQMIREKFFNGYREAEFVVVCDVKKESAQVIQELNDAQVTLIHVAATCKNAADEKLRQALRRFADTYCAPATVVLVSGDVNFAADLSDLRHRKKLHVILLHNEIANEALLLCASEHYCFTTMAKMLPVRGAKNSSPVEPMELVVLNLPKGYDSSRIKNRLKFLSNNCGGRVVTISTEHLFAVIRFTSLDSATRAQRRMDGEDVFGNKISVSCPYTIRNWEKSHSPYKYQGRKITKNPNSELYNHPPMYSIPPPKAPYPYLPLEYFSNIQTPFSSSAQMNYLEHAGGAIKKTHDVSVNSLEQHQSKKCDVFPYQYNHQPYMSSNLLNSQIRGPDGMRSIRGIHGAPLLTELNELRKINPVPENKHNAENNVPNGKLSARNFSGSFTSLNNMEKDDSDNYFQPVRSNSLSSASSSSPVELLVTNLDQTIDPQDLKKLLLSMFKEHAMVVSLSLFQQSDGNLAANVRVSSAQDAQYVISQLHRRKVGHKRVLISNAQTPTINPLLLRSQVVSLLQEVPGNRMPLFKFRELLETRFRNSVSISELYKLRDVCIVSDELGGRMVTLCADLRTTPSPHFNSQVGFEMTHCVIHCPNGLGERGWAEPEMPSLPNVRIHLKNFTSKVHALLHSHMGTLPLPSFTHCYEAEMGEKLPIDESGVPLEHLVTCVVGVDLRLGKNMIKYLVWGDQLGHEESHAEDSSTSSSLSGAINSQVKCVSPPLATQLALFSRELVDLLKTAPHCQLSFSKFIPAYHHHFGRQCRVADYGYTKLVDLFDALSHVIQIIGEGNKRIITLSHSTQIRRFTSDLLRVLKSHASKQVALSEFSVAYQRVLIRPFDPVDYGLCELSDLLEDVSENIVVIKKVTNDVIIAIPKREQTPEEIVKTKQFAVEVVDLLRHAPQYGMLFNKFVPAYHHHFGHQCRVSDYGFSKLIELFEAIPEVVKIEDVSDGERKVSLTPKEALKVVCDQILTLIKSSKLLSIPLATLSATFLREYGYPLRPDIYECSSLEDMIGKLSHSLQLLHGSVGTMVVKMEEKFQEQMGLCIWALLLQPPHRALSSELMQEFQRKFGFVCNAQQLEKHQAIIQISKNSNNELEISLTPRYALAARLYHLLYEAGGTILIGNIDGMYLRKYGEVLRPSDYEAPSLNILLSHMTFLVVVKGRKNKRNVSLSPNITTFGIQLPNNLQYASNENNSNEHNLNIQWPPPPLHTYLYNFKTMSPPKPDTPPAHGNNPIWENCLWNSSPGFSSSMNLCIPLPVDQTASLLESPSSLISPMKTLLPASTSNPFRNRVSAIKAPEPCELPMPNLELLNKGKFFNQSRDVSISTTNILILDEPDSSTNIETDSSTPTQKKRKPLKQLTNWWVSTY